MSHIWAVMVRSIILPLRDDGIDGSSSSYIQQGGQRASQAVWCVGGTEIEREREKHTE